jgi:hypothetical protein
MRRPKRIEKEGNHEFRFRQPVVAIGQLLLQGNFVITRTILPLQVKIEATVPSR